jgi:ubiquinone/menaquinone biosynthesis C-methylase UbiE
MKDYLSDDAIEKTWDSIAESFHKTRMSPWQQVIDFISELHINAIVGDFGCGNGRHTHEIARSGRKAIGIDISYKLLQIIQNNKETKQNINLIHGNVVNLPLKNHCLTDIIFIASLHNIPRQNQRMQSLYESFRVLKPGGQMLLSVWNQNHKNIDTIFDNVSMMDMDQKFLEPGDAFIFWTQDKLKIPRYYHLYTEEEIRKEVTSAGFQIKSFKEIKIATKTRPDNYFLTLKKEE